MAPMHDLDTDAGKGGGLHAEDGSSSRWIRWKSKIGYFARLNFARLRFVGVLVVVGVLLAKWDTLIHYFDKWTRTSTESATASEDFEWFCPMHPSVVRDNSKDKCPICFMPLSKRRKGTGEPDPLPAGTVSRVQLSPYRVVLAGVQLWRVEPRPLVKEITTVGYVEFDERGQRTVSARVAGRIDKLYANETGQMVRLGDELALVYSPDLLVTLQNLLDADKSGRAELVEGSRTRLRLLGVEDDQVDEMRKSGKVDLHVKIRSPISGHVIRKNIVEGEYVEQGTPLYEMADLSTVWIQAQIYEDDLPFLPIEHSAQSTGTQLNGVAITAVTPVFPDEPFEVKQAFVFPHVNPASRSVTLRFSLDNPGHKLRPGATATVKIRIPAHKMPMFQSTSNGNKPIDDSDAVLAVPESSIIDTGNQTVVYRESSPGTFEGLTVTLGPRMADEHGAPFFPVLRGLSEGDRVVTRGSFLVDAETRLNPSAGSIYYGGSRGAGNSASSAVRPSTPDDPQRVVQAALAKLDPADRELAMAQKYCPVRRGTELGSMGRPVKLSLAGETVFLCCGGCKEKAGEDPARTAASVRGLRADASKHPPASPTSDPDEEAQIAKALSRLSREDRKLAENQRFCAVESENRLGSMGPPAKVTVGGKAVFLCCEGCEEKALANPTKTLKQAEANKARK